jgi:hypothetical protein
MNRNEFLNQLKAIKFGDKTKDPLTEEAFQNETLRPILKLQNDLYILTFKQYCKKYKNVFFNLNLEKKELYIENALTKDQKFRNLMNGFTISLFNEEELQYYFENETNCNKRICSLLIERLKSQLQLFD